MEALTAKVYQGVKGCWRRRRYERLGGNGSGRKRCWRIRITRKLKFKCSPKKLIVRIRDGYVRMMMRLANSPVVAGSGGYGESVGRFGMRPMKEYDEKMIVEIYKALAMRQHQHPLPMDVPQMALCL